MRKKKKLRSSGRSFSSSPSGVDGTSAIVASGEPRRLRKTTRDAILPGASSDADGVQPTGQCRDHGVGQCQLSPG